MTTSVDLYDFGRLFRVLVGFITLWGLACYGIRYFTMMKIYLGILFGRWGVAYVVFLNCSFGFANYRFIGFQRIIIVVTNIFNARGLDVFVWELWFLFFLNNFFYENYIENNVFNFFLFFLFCLVVIIVGVFGNLFTVLGIFWVAIGLNFSFNFFNVNFFARNGFGRINGCRVIVGLLFGVDKQGFLFTTFDMGIFGVGT